MPSEERNKTLLKAKILLQIPLSQDQLVRSYNEAFPVNDNFVFFKQELLSPFLLPVLAQGPNSEGQHKRQGGPLAVIKERVCEITSCQTTQIAQTGTTLGVL